MIQVVISFITCIGLDKMLLFNQNLLLHIEGRPSQTLCASCDGENKNVLLFLLHLHETYSVGTH